jgi:hypothetical protein
VGGGGGGRVGGGFVGRGGCVETADNDEDDNK